MGHPQRKLTAKMLNVIVVFFAVLPFLAPSLPPSICPLQPPLHLDVLPCYLQQVPPCPWQDGRCSRLSLYVSLGEYFFVVDITLHIHLNGRVNIISHLEKST